MRTRVNVRCPACGWYTSRAPRANQLYGQCPRCWATLAAIGPPTRVYFRRDVPPSTPTSYHEQYATWPELVAAELERRDRLVADFAGILSSNRAPQRSAARESAVRKCWLKDPS